MIFKKYIIVYIFLFSFIQANIDTNKPIKLSVDEDSKSEYFGGWPINALKDKIKGPDLYYECPNEIGCDCKTNNDCINNNCKRSPRGSFCYPKEGDVFPEFISLDQYEENVNIYDFANQGKYILIELGTVWCAPCNDLANWFAYKDKEVYNKSWWKREYEKIYDMVHNDEVYFITILYEDENHDLVSYNTSYEWFDNYPDEKIPILIDSDKALNTWIKPSGIPTVILLNDKMEIVQFSTRGLNSSFDRLLELSN